MNVICVPECGGVPDASTTCAMIGSEPFAEMVLLDAVNVIVDPVGARSGTFSHASTSSCAANAKARRATRPRSDTIGEFKHSISMKLRGQQGYAMVALIVAMSIMAILMTAAMPTWRQMAQREKEAELIFRGQQYARAIGLFQKKSGPGVLPPNIDALVEGHYLRQKYKDPITGGDFDVLQAGATAGTPGAGTLGANTPGAGTLGAGTLNANTPGVGTLGPSMANPEPGGA